MPTDDLQRPSIPTGAAAVAPPAGRSPIRHFGHLSEERLDALFEAAPRPLRELTEPRQHAAAMGAVLYTPASRSGVADRFVGAGWRGLTAMAFCLEDAIADADLELAEAETRHLLERVADATERAGTRAQQPYLLVRVRTPEHLERLLEDWGPLADGIDGILLAKIGAERMAEYLPLVQDAQAGRDRPLWAVPILEGCDIAHKERRHGALAAIADLARSHRALVPCVRIGATDLSSTWALRRSRDFTIYDVSVIRDIVSDIVNFLGRDADAPAISGPVWEYIHEAPLFKPRLRETPFAEQFGPDDGPELRRALLRNAIDGLLRETLLDLANGLHGKTVIHPAHVVPVDAAYTVTHDEWVTARQIVEANAVGGGVEASQDGRMNEPKPHARWAERLLARAEAFGVLRPGLSFLPLLESE